MLAVKGEIEKVSSAIKEFEETENEKIELLSELSPIATMVGGSLPSIEKVI